MKLDVTVPTSLADIKLRDYQEFIKIASDKDITETFLRQKMVQIFCNIPLLAVNKMARKDFILISNALIEILKQKPKLTRITSLNGKEYGFIPNLSDDMTAGEFIDLDEYMRDWKDFHRSMAVLYRPITIKKGGGWFSNDKDINYRIREYITIADISTSKEIPEKKKLKIIKELKKNQEDMLNMTMDVVMGAVLFFWTLNTQLLKITPKYLTQQLRRNPKAAEVLEKNGVGISTFTNSLEEACSRLEKLLHYTLELRSIS